MSEQPFVAKWRTSALKRIRGVQALCGRKSITCTYLGARFTVDLDDLVGYDIAINRFEYRNLTRFLAACRRRRPAVFLDVGANIGTYTCAVGVSGVPAVFAFEPVPQLFAELQHNVGLNGFCADLRAVAVGDREGVARFTFPAGSNRGLAHVTEDGEIEVPMTALDKVLSHRDDVIAVKMDVEGFEAHVLDGAHELFSRNGGYAQIEARSDADIDAVTTRMSAFGWRQAGRHGLDLMFER
jgi:FkbM family methyltransferase